MESRRESKAQTNEKNGKKSSLKGGHKKTKKTPVFSAGARKGCLMVQMTVPLLGCLMYVYYYEYSMYMNIVYI